MYAWWCIKIKRIWLEYSKKEKVMKGRYKCFLRSTSNIDSKTGQKQIALPPKVWKQMGWKLNENLIIDTIKNGLERSIIIKKEMTENE